jgi:carbamoyl-phosphate synthase small subunit
LKKELADVPNMEGLELASKVSTTEPYFGEERMLSIKFRL